MLLASIEHFVASNSYALLFIGMVIEGPAITAGGGFAAALGALNLWIVFLLSVLGNLVTDIVFYTIGFKGRKRIIERYGYYFGATKEKIATAERLIKRHSGKSLIAIKMIPFVAFPGLVAAGAAKINFKKYLLWCISINILGSAIYLFLGYYCGAAYQLAIHYVYVGIMVIVAGIMGFLVIQRIEGKLSNRLAEGAKKDPLE